MNDPTMANQTLDISLSSEQLAALMETCQSVLSARPALIPWLRHVPLSAEVLLPFLPIRCYRLLNISRYTDAELTERQPHVFRSSGSTNDVRATHILGATGWSSYVRSSVEGYLDAAHRLGIPSNCPIVSLVPPRSQWPESSLAAMISIWKDNGLDVTYADVEMHPDSLAQLFSPHGQLAQANSCVIFGTTIHHLSIAHWHRTMHAGKAFVPAKNIWFFDTGGTKGRTLSTRSDLLYHTMQQWIIAPEKLSFLSEYGMCELSSQAYSCQNVHDGSFKCSPTLRALVLKPDFQSVCRVGERGFLAFIDSANKDSWPFILTEDIGEMLDPHGTAFRLHGRAPDATIKGCSLHVKTNFRFDLSEADSETKESTAGTKRNTAAQEETVPQKMRGLSPKTHSASRTLFSPEDLLRKLTRQDVWNSSTLEDLKASLIDWNNPAEEKQLLQNQHLKNKMLAIVTSANIPITWLFPAAVAWLSGARATDLYLPSIRQEDPLTPLIREQIRTLAEAFNQSAAFDFIRVFDNRLPASDKADYLLIFGSDTTVQAVSAAAAASAAASRVIGLGHFQNTIKISDGVGAEELARITSRWSGRGCLTPLLAIMPESRTMQETEAFAEKWLKHAADLKLRLAPDGLNSYPEFAHRHNLAELEATASAEGWTQLRAHSRTDAGLVCVILNGTPVSGLEQTGMDKKLLDWGGCGWLTITTESNLCSSWAALNSENPSPSLWQPHQGRLWTDWLSHAQKA
jgi:hypothetical protein